MNPAELERLGWDFVAGLQVGLFISVRPLREPAAASYHRADPRFEVASIEDRMVTFAGPAMFREATDPWGECQGWLLARGDQILRTELFPEPILVSTRTLLTIRVTVEVEGE